MRNSTNEEQFMQTAWSYAYVALTLTESTRGYPRPILMYDVRTIENVEITDLQTTVTTAQLHCQQTDSAVFQRNTLTAQ